jgi:hypothetical protein
VTAASALWLHRPSGILRDRAGRRFDPAALAWRPADRAPKGEPEGDPVDPAAAVRWLQRDSGRPCRIPIGVIGGREASPAQLALAEEVGAALARLGLAVLCGGREGVMAACCRGVAREGGVSIGLLPEETIAAANPHLTYAIATGIGIARNAIIAQGALCLVAIGGGLGTTSEVALGLQFGKRVFGLAGAPAIAGLRTAKSAEHAALLVAGAVLGLEEG